MRGGGRADADLRIIAWILLAHPVVDSPLWLQAITVEPAFPWQAGPVVGGIVR